MTEYVFLMGSVSFCFFVKEFLNPFINYQRRFVILALVLSLAYYYEWRITSTLGPLDTFEGQWTWFCFTIEMLFVCESALFFALMWKRTDNSPLADAGEKRLRSLPIEKIPYVDVFITSYNEPLEVIERTMLGALVLDWPKERLNVCLLDDGEREFVKEYCKEIGVNYIGRKVHTGAKAGNINNALAQTQGEFFLVLDADFIPFHNFLYRTVGLFEDPKIGIVQTPHFFFNKDIMQINLHLENYITDEQRNFFNILMPARDGWDSAFCCGTNGIIRRKAIETIGTIPEDNVTEDMLTSMKLLRKGYVTRYLNEKLAHGLAPETVSRQVIQKRRWCQGSIDCFFSKDGSLGRNLTFMQRVLFTPFYWITTPILSVLSLLIPLGYLWFGLPSLMIDHYIQVVGMQVPIIIMNLYLIPWLGNNHFIPFIAPAMTTLTAIHVLPETIKTLLTLGTKHHFNVTPKGFVKNKNEAMHIPSFIFVVFLFLATLGGLLFNTFDPLRDSSFFPVAAFWSVWNLIVISLMIFLSLDHPKKPEHEKFPIKKPIQLTINGGTFETMLDELSYVECHVMMDIPNSVTVGTQVTLYIPEVGDIQATISHIQQNRLDIEFDSMDELVRRKLIQFIYSGKHDNHTETKNLGAVVKKLLHRAFLNHSHLYKEYKPRKMMEIKGSILNKLTQTDKGEQSDT